MTLFLNYDILKTKGVWIVNLSFLFFAVQVLFIIYYGIKIIVILVNGRSNFICFNCKKKEINNNERE